VCRVTTFGASATEIVEGTLRDPSRQRPETDMKTLTSTTTLVIGCGNHWTGDDCAGLCITRELARIAPEGVDVRESGGDALKVLDWIAEPDAVVFVDAVSSGDPPGTIHLGALPNPAITPRCLEQLTTHGLDLNLVIDLGRRLGRPIPPIGLIGIEMSVTEGATMSRVVADACARVIANFDHYLEWLRRLRPGDPVISVPPEE